MRKPEVSKEEEIETQKENLRSDISKAKKQIEEIEEEEPTLRPVNKSRLKEKIQVVKELPVQQVRQIKDKDGTIINFYTIEEYLTLMANEED